jgi:hypothetical protein
MAQAIANQEEEQREEVQLGREDRGVQMEGSLTREAEDFLQSLSVFQRRPGKEPMHAYA